MPSDGADVKVRRMVGADLPRLTEIDRLLEGEHRVSTWPFSFQSYWSVYHPEMAFVAEVDQVPVGFLLGSIKPMEGTQSILRRADMQVMPPTRHQKVGWIEMIGVDPASQHKGVGRLLVEAFHEECRRNDAMLQCLVRLNDSRLAGFYSRLGFRPWDTVIYTKD